MKKLNIGVLVGSLRKDSFTRAIAKAAAELAPENLEFNFLEIGDLALYNQDLDDGGNPPEAWVRFRKEAAKADGFLFATPEYNRAMPAVLKNALDVGSRPYGLSIWDGKPAAIISVTPGGLGAFGANHQLRQPMVFLNMPVMQQPEVYISKVMSLLDDKNNLTDESTRGFLKEFMDLFANWVEKFADK